MAGFMAPTVGQFSNFGRSSTPTYGSGFGSTGYSSAGTYGRYASPSVSNAAGSQGSYAMPKPPRAPRAASQPRGYGAPTTSASPYRSASPAPGMYSGMRQASPLRGNFSGMAPASIAAATTGVAMQPAGAPTAALSGAYPSPSASFSGTIVGGAYQSATSPVTGQTPYAGQPPPQYLSTRLEQNPGTVASSASRSNPGTLSGSAFSLPASHSVNYAPPAPSAPMYSPGF